MTDVVALDMGNRLFSSRPVDWAEMAKRYGALRPYVSTAMKLLIDMRRFGLPYQAEAQHCSMLKMSLRYRADWIPGAC